MDEEYILSSDSSDDDLSSVSTNQLHVLLEDLSETDICDIIIDIYDQLDHYTIHNVLSLSSPTFYKDMFGSIAFVLCNEWSDASLFDHDEDDELFEELVDFVEQTWEVYSDFCEIPLRSVAYENLQSDCTNLDVNVIRDKLDHLNNLPQPTQRTPEWYEFRNNLLSASSISKVFGSEAMVNSLIYEKCSPTTCNYSRCNIESALHWGVKYEPVTVMIYEDMFGTVVGEFGCIRHVQYGFIGASPDGINMDPECTRYGRMLEIKNIFNRDITGIPKEEYWVQTQIQMEVCDLDYCDFIETRIKEYSGEGDFYADASHEYKGIILHFIETNYNSPTINQPSYKYMPLDKRLSVNDWIQQERELGKVSGIVLFNTIYWYLDEYSCVLIPRNKEWFKAALPKIENIWQIIVKERECGYEHRATKKKVLKNTIVTSDMTGNTYQIENMNLTKSVCLIKLG